MKLSTLSLLVTGLLLTFVLIMPNSVYGASAETCDKYGIIQISGGKYIVQNNVWGADTKQCVSVPDTNVASFTVSVSQHNQGSVAAYPSIYLGDHWGTRTSGWTSIKISSLSTASFSWSVSYSGISGTYNVAAEAWFDADPTGDGGYSGGAELMIWMHYQGMQPAGSQIATVTIDGQTYEVWYANIGWNYIAYRQSGRSSASYNLKNFINDAVNRGYIQTSWYFHDIEAGFEIMSGGQGLKVNSFSASASGGGGGVTTTTTSKTTTSKTTTSKTTTTTSKTTTAATTSTGATCSPATAISIPFTKDGAGTYCWSISSLNYINSWNLQQLTVNGVDFTNKYATASQLPAKINGNWYIYYVGNYAWSHFEAK